MIIVVAITGSAARIDAASSTSRPPSYRLYVIVGMMRSSFSNAGMPGTGKNASVDAECEHRRARPGELRRLAIADSLPAASTVMSCSPVGRSDPQRFGRSQLVRVTPDDADVGAECLRRRGRTEADPNRRRRPRHDHPL